MGKAADQGAGGYLFNKALRWKGGKMADTNARKYTVSEIDRMRYAIECRWLFGCCPKELHRSGGGGCSRPYKEEEKVKCVEEMLRTYMLAGTSPAELEG